MSLLVECHTLEGLGCVYAPSGEGPFPAVMLLHGSEGAWSGWSHRHAVLLAAHGFLAFPLGYSRGGNAWRAGDIEDCSIDRCVDAFKGLKQHSLSGQSAGIYGLSRGAELALLIAVLSSVHDRSAIPDAVAVHSPSDCVCGAFQAANFLPCDDPGRQPWDPSKRAWTWQGSHDGLLPSTPIEVERYAGPVLVSHGEADSIWSVASSQRLKARLDERGGEHEVYLYPGEDHVLSPEAETLHHQRLVSFFRRYLTA
ncbi:prolyl oligopeptidase family serine peptidase [Halomonas denitrificans]|uniref:alpha/beta hydrolase family protein n=1 Tax=Halomonas denitrificans TaxID=370769 RepID=UPI001CD280EE|nr:prolyl oligopeptidase family serine peptidase [Halomonas denitrificans]MCA0975265.1 prolyl oligopeptidase family serine peptidase [Halomonas denitrificans]